MGKGSTIPKGRFALPREPKSKTKDRILVFAEGRQAEEAKSAGADVVGGPELVDGVSRVSTHFIVWLNDLFLRLSVAVIKQPCSYAHLL